MKNVPDYGYNPVISADRVHMALHLIWGKCHGARTVGQKTISKEIYGITSSKPDYVVLYGVRDADIRMIDAITEMGHN